MALQRWDRIYNELQGKAEKLGYNPPLRIGGEGSQTYEFRIKRRPVVLIAFRDLGRKQDYSTPDRLWAEGLDLVLRRYEEHRRAGVDPLPPAIAVVIDNIADSYVVVTMNDLLDLYRERGAEFGHTAGRKFTFIVHRRKNGYFLVMPHGVPEAPLTNVNSVESVVLLLKAMRPPWLNASRGP